MGFQCQNYFHEQWSSCSENLHACQVWNSISLYLGEHRWGSCTDLVGMCSDISILNTYVQKYFIRFLKNVFAISVVFIIIWNTTKWVPPKFWKYSRIYGNIQGRNFKAWWLSLFYFIYNFNLQIVLSHILWMLYPWIQFVSSCQVLVLTSQVSLTWILQPWIFGLTLVLFSLTHWHIVLWDLLVCHCFYWPCTVSVA